MDESATGVVPVDMWLHHNLRTTLDEVYKEQDRRRDKKNMYHGILNTRKKGYNSHGGWTTLSDIRETELERGNVFPHISYPDNTPAIWICFTRRKALRYIVPADDWERVDDETKPLTKSETEIMRFDVQEIDLLPTDVIVHDDGDEGYLLLRPTKQITLFPWMK